MGTPSQGERPRPVGAGYTRKFQVSNAVKHDGDTAGTERMTAKLNGKCDMYFSVDTMALKSVVTEGTIDSSNWRCRWQRSA